MADDIVTTPPEVFDINGLVQHTRVTAALH